jgi:hypothetical protein
MKKILCALMVMFGASTFTYAEDNGVKVKKDGDQLVITKPEVTTTNHLNIFKIKTNGKQVRIKPVEGKDQIEMYFSSSGEEVVILFKATGTYNFMAFTAISDNLVEFDFTVDVVDDPSNPKPIPVIPPDPLLLESFRKIYSSNVDPKKSEQLKGLIEVMKFAVTEAKDGNYASNRDFAAKIQDKTKEKLGDNALNSLRIEIGKYLNQVLPSDKVVSFDKETRTLHKNEYQKIVIVLEAIAK